MCLLKIRKAKRLFRRLPHYRHKYDMFSENKYDTIIFVLLNVRVNFMIKL